MTIHLWILGASLQARWQASSTSIIRCNAHSSYNENAPSQNSTTDSEWVKPWTAIKIVWFPTLWLIGIDVCNSKVCHMSFVCPLPFKGLRGPIWASRCHIEGRV